MVTVVATAEICLLLTRVAGGLVHLGVTRRLVGVPAGADTPARHLKHVGVCALMSSPEEHPVQFNRHTLQRQLGKVCILSVGVPRCRQERPFFRHVFPCLFDPQPPPVNCHQHQLYPTVGFMDSGVGYPWYGLTVGDDSKVYSDFGRLTGIVYDMLRVHQDHTFAFYCTANRMLSEPIIACDAACTRLMP